MFMLRLLVSWCCSSQTVNLHSNLCWTRFGVLAPDGSGLCCRRFEIHAASIFRIETKAVFIGNPIYFNLQIEAACSSKCRQRILLPQGSSTKNSFNTDHIPWSWFETTQVRISSDRGGFYPVLTVLCRMCNGGQVAADRPEWNIYGFFQFLQVRV